MMLASMDEIAEEAEVDAAIDRLVDEQRIACLKASWRAGRELLEANGLVVHHIRERIGLVEAEVSDGTDRARVEWAGDSSYASSRSRSTMSLD
jgi:hypothetical protein